MFGSPRPIPSYHVAEIVYPLRVRIFPILSAVWALGVVLHAEVVWWVLAVVRGDLRVKRLWGGRRARR
jgi:hypothetical protein